MTIAALICVFYAGVAFGWAGCALMSINKRAP